MERVERQFYTDSGTIRPPRAGGEGGLTCATRFRVIREGLTGMLASCPQGEHVLKLKLQEAWVEAERVYRREMAASSESQGRLELL